MHHLNFGFWIKYVFLHSVQKRPVKPHYAHIFHLCIDHSSHRQDLGQSIVSLWRFSVVSYRKETAEMCSLHTCFEFIQAVKQIPGGSFCVTVFLGKAKANSLFCERRGTELSSCCFLLKSNKMTSRKLLILALWLRSSVELDYHY